MSVPTRNLLDRMTAWPAWVWYAMVPAWGTAMVLWGALIGWLVKGEVQWSALFAGVAVGIAVVWARLGWRQYRRSRRGSGQ